MYDLHTYNNDSLHGDNMEFQSGLYITATFVSPTLKGGATMSAQCLHGTKDMCFSVIM